jgi:hypothetical protein
MQISIAFFTDTKSSGHKRRIVKPINNRLIFVALITGIDGPLDFDARFMK